MRRVKWLDRTRITQIKLINTDFKYRILLQLKNAAGFLESTFHHSQLTTHNVLSQHSKTAPPLFTR